MICHQIFHHQVPVLHRVRALDVVHVDKNKKNDVFFSYLKKYEPHLTKAQVPCHWFIHEEALVQQLVDNWELVWPDDLISGC